jgi:hypothetical protein
MKHARKDYNRIQDPEEKIGRDEPVFLLRAQDKHFVPMLEDYFRHLAMSGEAQLEMLEAVSAQITRAKQWQAEHGVKAPDMPVDAVVTTEGERGEG